MAIMKRDVNIVLLLLIVVGVAGFAGFSVYYQGTFENISTGYNEKISELQEVTDELTMHKTKLDQTSYELEIKEERESDLKTKYDGLKDDKDELEDQNAQLDSELSKTKSELDLKRAELTQKQAELSTVEAELANTKLRLSLRKQRPLCLGMKGMT